MWAYTLQYSHTMQLDKKTKCIVRVSISLDAIIKGLSKSENNKIEKIRIVKSMEVILENDLNEAFANLQRFTFHSRKVCWYFLPREK